MEHDGWVTYEDLCNEPETRAWIERCRAIRHGCGVPRKGEIESPVLERSGEEKPVHKADSC